MPPKLLQRAQDRGTLVREGSAVADRGCESFEALTDQMGQPYCGAARVHRRQHEQGPRDGRLAASEDVDAASTPRSGGVAGSGEWGERQDAVESDRGVHAAALRRWRLELVKPARSSDDPKVRSDKSAVATFLGMRSPWLQRALVESPQVGADTGH